MAGLTDRCSQTIDAISSGVYFDNLVNTPTPHELRSAPELVQSHDSVDRATHTIVVPTFEHDAVVARNLGLMEQNSTLPHDLIIIDDASSDDTVKSCLDFLAAGDLCNLKSWAVLRNPVPIFETACDNIGFVAAATSFIIEVQADIQVRELGYDEILVAALRDFPDCSTCSGRAGHAFLDPPNFWPWDKARFSQRQIETSVGLMNDAIQDERKASAFVGYVYESETVNRGPWALRKDDLERYGYLDEQNFFLGADDHDINRRIYQKEGRRPFYVPLRVCSPLADGAQRRERTGINETIWNILRSSRKGSKAYTDFLRGLRGKRTPPRPISWRGPRADLDA